MSKLSKKLSYFTTGEYCLWGFSVFLIVLSFVIFDRTNYFTFCSSLLGVTSLIFIAKGNPFGQFLMIFFGIMYAGISYTYAYYGELITYLGMTLPMAVFALGAWLKNPYQGKISQVTVNKIGKKDIIWMILLTSLVTLISYFILDAFHTANLIPSTFSVSTSFLAVFLTYKRSPYFALCYAANDIVLIILWILATMKNFSYLSVVVCFLAFLFHDLYSFFNWKRMQVRQSKGL